MSEAYWINTWIKTLSNQEVFVIWSWCKTVKTLCSSNCSCLVPSSFQFLISTCCIYIFLVDNKGFDFWLFPSCCCPIFIPLMETLGWSYCVSCSHIERGMFCLPFQRAIHTINSCFTMPCSWKHPLCIIVKVFLMMTHLHLHLLCCSKHRLPTLISAVMALCLLYSWIDWIKESVNSSESSVNSCLGSFSLSPKSHPVHVTESIPSIPQSIKRSMSQCLSIIKPERCFNGTAVPRGRRKLLGVSGER